MAPAGTWRTAAGVTGRLGHALSAHELEALWAVLAVLRSLGDGDPATGELQELLPSLGTGRSTGGCADDLERVLAVPALGIPAVKAVPLL